LIYRFCGEVKSARHSRGRVAQPIASLIFIYKGGNIVALIKIHVNDNVAVAIDDIQKNETVTVGEVTVTAKEEIAKGHKIALRDIKNGEDVIKYGFAIGHAIAEIPAGGWIHAHNLKTNLGELLTYEYQPAPAAKTGAQAGSVKTFKGYRLQSGKVGVRNEVWIIPTVSCVNRNVQLMAKYANEKFKDAKNVDGVFEFIHPYGCSQLGDDHKNTQKVLADMVNHPNAGAVLVVGLGCENNNIDEFKKVLGEYDEQRVKFLVAQNVEDEIEAGLELIEGLVEYAGHFEREACQYLNWLLV
jgi:altronate hydrolase